MVRIFKFVICVTTVSIAFVIIGHVDVQQNVWSSASWPLCPAVDNI